MRLLINKLRDQEARSQREINLLLEKLSQKNAESTNYDKLVNEYNTAKTNYEVSFNLVFNFRILILF